MEPIFYLAHPRNSRYEIRKWELEFEKKSGMTLLNPFYDCESEDTRSNELGDEKYKTLENSDAIVLGDIQVICDPKTIGSIHIVNGEKSYGTIQEMVYATQFKKESYSLVTNGDENHPWLKRHSDKIFTKREDLEEFLMENIERWKAK